MNSLEVSLRHTEATVCARFPSRFKMKNQSSASAWVGSFQGAAPMNADQTVAARDWIDDGWLGRLVGTETLRLVQAHGRDWPAWL